MSSVFSFRKIKGYCKWKLKFYRLCVQNPDSGLIQIGHKLEKWQGRQDLTTWRHRPFFDVVLFLVSSFETVPTFKSISSLILELWQFSFIRDWPGIQKLEISPFEFCPISWDRVELGILNLTLMSNVTGCCKTPEIELLPFLRY